MPPVRTPMQSRLSRRLSAAPLLALHQIPARVKSTANVRVNAGGLSDTEGGQQYPIVVEPVVGD